MKGTMATFYQVVGMLVMWLAVGTAFWWCMARLFNKTRLFPHKFEPNEGDPGHYMTIWCKHCSQTLEEGKHTNK
jgi:hypothetical protein